MEKLKWFILCKDLGFFAIATGTISYVIQKIINQSADKKFEKYKTELDHKTREFQIGLDAKIEIHKAELNLKNYKSTKTYDEQLQTTIQLYKKLVKLNRDMEIMTAIVRLANIDPSKEESDELQRINNTGNSFNDFSLFQEDHEIFFPETTVEKLYKIRTNFHKTYNGYLFQKQFPPQNTDEYDHFKETSKQIQSEIEIVLNQLKLEFRELIGISPI